MPKANPEYSLGSYPFNLRTRGLTIPAPRISRYPLPLQTGQPLPPHLSQLTSTSTLGSVNGKYELLILISRFSPNNFFTKVSKVFSK